MLNRFRGTNGTLIWLSFGIAGTLALCSLAVLASGAESKSPTGYHVIKHFNIGGDGGWDYISIDSEARRLYVSHGTQLEVLDADSGKVVGQILDTPGVHGAAIAHELNRGFTSNGRDKSVTIFDLKTLKTIKRVSLEGGTDFILYDPFTKRVFPMNEKITVIDARSGEVAGTLDPGGDPEAAVADGNGHAYLNIADKGALAVVDTKALTVTNTYPLERCVSPHSMSYDSANQRVFVGCAQGGMVAVDAASGKIVGRSNMCAGVDASGFDPDSKLIFESCGEGVVSVIRQTTPDFYELIETVLTQLRARTMAFDHKTKNIYLPTAEFDNVPNTDPRYPAPFIPKVRPGTFTIVVVGK
jgi:DNA-binding beta-propeller fold protein YncE